MANQNKSLNSNSLNSISSSNSANSSNSTKSLNSTKRMNNSKSFYSDTPLPKPVSNFKLIIDYIIISCIIILQVLITSIILNLFFTRLNTKDSYGIIVLKTVIEIFLLMLFVYLTINILNQLIEKFGNSNMLYIMKISPILSPFVTILLILSFTYILKDKLFSKLQFLTFSVRNNIAYHIPEIKNVDIIFQSRLKDSIKVTTDNSKNNNYQIVRKNNNNNNRRINNNSDNIDNDLKVINEEDNVVFDGSTVDYSETLKNNSIYRNKHRKLVRPNIYKEIYNSEKYYNKNNYDIAMNDDIKGGESSYVE